MFNPSWRRAFFFLAGFFCFLLFVLAFFFLGISAEGMFPEFGWAASAWVGRVLLEDGDIYRATELSRGIKTLGDTKISVDTFAAFCVLNRSLQGFDFLLLNERADIVKQV